MISLLLTALRSFAGGWVIKLLIYALAAACGAGITWHVMHNDHREDMLDMVKANDLKIEQAVLAERDFCLAGKTITQEVDHAVTEKKNDASVAYARDLERLLAQSRSSLATLRASSDASQHHADACPGHSGAQPEAILRLGYDGQINGEIAQGCQAFICKIYKLNGQAVTGCE